MCPSTEGVNGATGQLLSTERAKVSGKWACSVCAVPGLTGVIAEQRAVHHLCGFSSVAH